MKVLITGGAASPFVIVYFLIIIGASILFYRRGSMITAFASALLYGILYSAGRFFTEGLRTDSLCVGTYTLDGSCTNGLRIAQLVSLGAFAICGRKDNANRRTLPT